MFKIPVSKSHNPTAMFNDFGQIKTKSPAIIAAIPEIVSASAILFYLLSILQKF